MKPSPLSLAIPENRITLFYAELRVLYNRRFALELERKRMTLPKKAKKKTRQPKKGSCLSVRHERTISCPYANQRTIESERIRWQVSNQIFSIPQLHGRMLRESNSWKLNPSLTSPILAIGDWQCQHNRTSHWSLRKGVTHFHTIHQAPTWKQKEMTIIW